jgi:hypothetical protein
MKGDAFNLSCSSTQSKKAGQEACPTKELRGQAGRPVLLIILLQNVYFRASCSWRMDWPRLVMTPKAW